MINLSFRILNFINAFFIMQLLQQYFIIYLGYMLYLHVLYIQLSKIEHLKTIFKMILK